MHKISELFDYVGFLQECEEARIKYKYSMRELSRAAGLDPDMYSYSYSSKSLGFASAAGYSAVLNVSIDKYVRAL